jgi:hypothetical protein
MANRTCIFALAMLLLATWSSPTYCAAMLGASTAAGSVATADEASAQEAHQHHHHEMTDDSAVASGLHFSATPPPCNDCGPTGAAALTPSGSSRLAIATAPDSSGFDPTVYDAAELRADPEQQHTSPDLPFLTPLRI